MLQPISTKEKAQLHSEFNMKRADSKTAESSFSVDQLKYATLLSLVPILQIR